MEGWRDIKDYEGLYQVSNLGRIKSFGNGKTRKEKILKSRKDGCGYHFVTLYKEGKVKTYKVHRLVAQAFIPNPDNLPQINHIDENKSNNCVDNLEWCDCKYNINYGSRNERTAKTLSKSLSKPILQFSKTGEFIKRWDGLRQVERELGVKNNNITHCLKGRSKTAGDYKWGYEKDYELIPFKVFDLKIYKKIT